MSIAEHFSKLGRAVALLVLVAAAGACTTTELPPRLVTDSRDAPQPSRDAGRKAGSAQASAQAEADLRRRAGIRVELGAGFYQQGNYAQALEELRQAIAIDPTFAQAYGVIGLVHMDLGERERAEESFRRAVQLAPDDSETLNNYGWFLCQTGRFKESIDQFMAALKNPLYSTPARPLHNAGICSLRSGDDTAAENFFRRAFQIEPSNPVAMYNLAELYLKQGDPTRARFYSQRLLSSYPASAETLWLAIRIDRRVGERDSLASLSTQLRRQFPTSREAGLLQTGAFGD